MSEKCIIVIYGIDFAIMMKMYKDDESVFTNNF